VLESLALLYRSTLEPLELLAGRSIARVHVVGGGSRSDLPNQFTADATGRPVIAGPVEASAIGNALVQAFTLGRIGPDPSAVRGVVRASFPTRTFTPSGDPRWRAAHERFQRLPVA
jgi:rhamnulokinase